MYHKTSRECISDFLFPATFWRGNENTPVCVCDARLPRYVAGKDDANENGCLVDGDFLN